MATETSDDIYCINEKCQLAFLCKRAIKKSESQRKRTAVFVPREKDGEMKCGYFIDKYRR